jgi:hypothetical protein
MNKLYITLLSLTISVVGFSQSINNVSVPIKNAQHIKSKDINASENIINSKNGGQFVVQKTNPTTPVALGCGIWSDDFSTPSNWVMSKEAGTTGDWVINNVGPTGGFSIGAINSTTKSNGFALFDSDVICSGNVTAHITTANSINLSAFSNVSLIFQQYYARWYDSTFVYVSNDNVSWTKYPVNTTLANNAATANPLTTTINISATAANQATVWIRFTFYSPSSMGPNAGCGYSWMIDDVSITSTINDLSLVKKYNYSIADSTSTEYFTMIPKRHAMADTLLFGAKYKNNDVSNGLTNVQLTTSVTGAGTYTGTSTPKSLAANATDSVNVNSLFTFNGKGVYNVDYTISATEPDGNSCNNSHIRTVDVNDTVYAWDNGAQKSASWYGTAGQKYVIGNIFPVYKADTAKSISVYFGKFNAPFSQTGKSLKIFLWDFNSPTPAIIDSFATTYTLTAADTNKWKTFPMLNKKGLNPGWYVASFESQNDTLLFTNGGTSAYTAPPLTVWVKVGTGNWGYGSSIPFIRLNLAEPCLSFDVTATATDQNMVGSNDGTATATPVNGTSPYTYAWSNTGTSSTISGLAPGTYTVTVTDYLGCSDTASAIVNPVVCNLTVSTSSTNETTAGANDGTATATPASGNTPYTYSWSNSGTTSAISGLAPGTYTVTVTDAKGCTANGSATVAAGATPTCDSLVYSDGKGFVVNPNDFTGYVVNFIDNDSLPPATPLANLGITSQWQIYSDSIAPGDTNFYYGATSWFQSPGQADNWIIFGGTSISSTGADLSWDHLFADNGYRDGYEVLINTNGPTLADFAGATSLFSVTDNDASTNGDTVWTSNSVNISGATYGGQKVYIAFHHNAFDQFLLFLDNILIKDCNPDPCANANIKPNGVATSPNCSGSTGSINTAPTGGTTPYTYSWSNAATTQNLTGLASGTYTVTVTDSNGCKKDTTFTITVPTAISVNATSTNETSAGANDGTATAAPTGGTPPYTYSWSNSATTSSISGLAPGTYSVTVTDNNGCTNSATVVVNQFGCNMTATVTGTNETSAGANNGTATATPANGTTPYSYSWSNSGSTATISGLAPGIYSVTITDQAGCLATGSYTVQAGPVCNLTVTVTGTNETSAGANNGTATANASNGATPYSYSWSNSATTTGITGLAPGTYSVTVTDQSGCTASGSYTVQAGPATCTLKIDSVKVTNPTCFGFNNGMATVFASGGTTTMTYAWSNGSSSSTAINLTAQAYSVTVTSGNCTKDTIVVVTQPSALTGVMSSTNETCQGCADGTASVTVTGGTTPYTYQWPQGQSTSSITGLSPGTYSVIVTDAKGCTYTGTVNIQAGPNGLDEINSDNLSVSVYPNPAHNRFYISVDSKLTGNVNIEILNSIGQVAYNTQSVNKASFVHELNISEWSSGIYFIKVYNSETINIQKLIVE